MSFFRKKRQKRYTRIKPVYEGTYYACLAYHIKKYGYVDEELMFVTQNLSVANAQLESNIKKFFKSKEDTQNLLIYEIQNADPIEKTYDNIKQCSLFIDLVLFKYGINITTNSNALYKKTLGKIMLVKQIFAKQRQLTQMNRKELIDHIKEQNYSITTMFHTKTHMIAHIIRLELEL